MFDFTKELTDSSIQLPLELLYMSRLRTWLGAVNMWSYHTSGPPTGAKKVLHFLQDKFLLPLGLCCCTSQLKYLWSHHKTMGSVASAKSWVSAMIGLISCSRLPMVWNKYYRDVTEEFVTEFHLFHHRNKSETAMKVYKEVHIYCVALYKTVFVGMTVGVPLYNIGSVLANVFAGMMTSDRPVNGTFFYSVYFEVPFNTENWLPGYLVIFTLTAMLSYWTAICLFGLDLYLAVIVLHTWGHLKILDREMRTFRRPAKNNWYTREESEEVLELLKQHIHYHTVIIAFMKQTSKAFGPILGIYLFFHQANGCILLLQCSQLDAIALLEFGILTVCLYVFLVMMSVVFEVLGTQVDNVAEAVYMLPWECMGLRERKVALIFLGQAQAAAAHARLKAMGLVPVGVSTMAAIIKTSISYFMILRSTTR